MALHPALLRAQEQEEEESVYKLANKADYRLFSGCTVMYNKVSNKCRQNITTCT